VYRCGIHACEPHTREREPERKPRLPYLKKIRSSLAETIVLKAVGPPSRARALSPRTSLRLGGSANVTKAFPGEAQRDAPGTTYEGLWGEHHEAGMEQLAGLREWLDELERMLA
jgi:hypothetical protein